MVGPIKNNFETIRFMWCCEECRCPDCKQIEECEKCNCGKECDLHSELWDYLQKRTEVEIKILIEQINQQSKLILCSAENYEIIVDFRPWSEPKYADFRDLAEEIMRLTAALMEREGKTNLHGWWSGGRGRLSYSTLWGNGTIYGTLHFEGDDWGKLAHIHYYNNSQIPVSKDDVEYELYDPKLYRWLIACEKGDLEYIATQKISFTDVRANNYQALRGACKNGHLAVVKFLEQYYKLEFAELAGRMSPPSERGWGSARTKNGLADSESEKRSIIPQLFFEAGKHNQIGILKWLSPFSSCPYNIFLKILASGAHLPTVQCLIEEGVEGNFGSSYRRDMSAECLFSQEFVSVCKGGQVSVLEWLRTTDYTEEEIPSETCPQEILPDIEYLEKGFAGACKNGHLDMARYIISTYKDGCEEFNPLAKIDESSTLRTLLKNGWVDLLKYLREDLGLEVKWGRGAITLEAFRYIISIDPTQYEEGKRDARAISFILCEENDFRVVREIMERPELGYKFPLDDLTAMCRYGHLQLAKYHAERSKPSPAQFLAIYKSIKEYYNAPVIDWCLDNMAGIEL